MGWSECGRNERYNGPEQEWQVMGRVFVVG